MRADDDLVDIAVVARDAGVSANTVRNWIHRGRIKAGRTPSGRWKVTVAELSRIIKSLKSHESHEPQVPPR